MAELQVEQHLINQVSRATNLAETTVRKVVQLLDEGNTVPFIARYRKEVTGGLDEVAIKNIHDKWMYAVNLHERKEEVLRLIDEQGKLTDELKEAIQESTQLQRVEDLYRPYRQKRRTRATIAKEKGLEPFAKLIWQQKVVDLAKEATQYFSDEYELYEFE